MPKRKRYTLIVIDMQPHFVAACNNRILINNIKKEIYLAKNNNNHIIFLRYYSCGSITKSLRDATAHYKNISIITKNDMDGGKLVLNELSNIGKSNLRICGINTEQCVLETAATISESYPKKFKIEIIARCCATATSVKRHEQALSIMAKEFNIIIDNE